MPDWHWRGGGRSKEEESIRDERSSAITRLRAAVHKLQEVQDHVSDAEEVYRYRQSSMTAPSVFMNTAVKMEELKHCYFWTIDEIEPTFSPWQSDVCLTNRQ
jgi:hypothetical protein